MGNTKQINIKNLTYYFFNDMINIKNFDPSMIKIGKKLYKNIGIYYIGYIIININSANPLYLMIGEVDGYIEENNGNKYLTFASADKNKKVLEEYTKLWDEIKYHIQTSYHIIYDIISYHIQISNSDKSGKYEKNYMKIKFSSDDDLPLNKILKLHMLATIVRYVFEETGKYYSQVFLDDCLYEV